MEKAQSLASFFDKQWDLYTRAITSGVLCHTEMFSTLSRFLEEKFGDHPFRFVDFGCGDSSAVLPTLLKKPVRHYIGVDSATQVIANAATTLSALNCEKTLIVRDMADALPEIPAPADVMFCSYSLHHLSLNQKNDFIQNCYDLLASPGYFILVDGVRSSQETREEWLRRLSRRFVDIAGFNELERAEIMKHPTDFDFPETVETFRTISQNSGFKKFEILFERDDFLAFMVFTK
jgi:SAM-dependent methyltransferase